MIAKMQDNLNNVYILSDDGDDLSQQREDYLDYIQDADIGALVFFRWRSALCCRATVESWIENPERGKLYTFSEYADMLIYRLILEKMNSLDNAKQ